MMLKTKIKQMLCRHEWKDIPRFVNLSTGRIRKGVYCTKCNKKVEVE